MATDEYERKKIVVKFAVFTAGVFLNFAGYLVLLSLQSSINIEDGAGAASVTATYITAALFGVLFTPILLRSLGPKTCVIVCELTYFVYIIINYYPVMYTLIPAGIIVGIGEATMWPVMILFCVHYARCFARYGSKKPEFYTTEFLGWFYLIFQFSAVFGNLLNYGILYGGKSPIVDEDDNSSTSATPVFRDLSICGRNDCQDPNVTNQNLNRYEPASEMLIYILIGVTAVLVVIAMLIQGFLIKNIDPSKEVQTKEKLDSDEPVQDKTEMSSIQLIMSTLKATLLHLIKPKQLLITPFALYTGLVIYFGLGEITRAYGSCMLGVEQVGLLAALTGTADGIASYVSCKISARFGRNVTMCIGIVVDITYYMVCLFWIPTEDSLWVVYLIFISVGFSDGTWQPWVNELHSAYFPDELDIALTVWNMYVIVGIAWQAGWSTSLCVATKIYVQIGLLCFSIVCYTISQYFFKTKDSQENEKKSWTIGTKL